MQLSSKVYISDMVEWALQGNNIHADSKGDGCRESGGAQPER